MDNSLRTLTSYRLRRAVVKIMAEFNQVFARYGLRRTTFSVLTIIIDNPGLRQSDLAAVVAIERPNLVQIVDELEAAGLAERTPAPDDRRAYAIRPTPAGKALHLKAMAVARALDADLMRDLTAEQLDVLHGLLTAIEGRGTGAPP